MVCAEAKTGAQASELDAHPDLMPPLRSEEGAPAPPAEELAGEMQPGLEGG